MVLATAETGRVFQLKLQLGGKAAEVPARCCLVLVDQPRLQSRAITNAGFRVSEVGKCLSIVVSEENTQKNPSVKSFQPDGSNRPEQAFL